MKALTIRQPWAQLIIEGHKDIENRDWPTRVRGRIAIHCSARILKSDVDQALSVFSMATGQPFSMDLRSQWLKDLPTGAIVGTADLVDCVDDHHSDWFFGDYGFILRNPVKLAIPIPLKGALGFWDVPAEIAQQLTKVRTR